MLERADRERDSSAAQVQGGRERHRHEALLEKRRSHRGHDKDGNRVGGDEQRENSHDTPADSTHYGSPPRATAGRLEGRTAGTACRRRSRNIAIGPTIASARIGGDTYNGRSSGTWKSPARRMIDSSSATVATTITRPRRVLTVVRGSVTMKKTNS